MAAMDSYEAGVLTPDSESGREVGFQNANKAKRKGRLKWFAVNTDIEWAGLVCQEQYKRNRAPSVFGFNHVSSFCRYSARKKDGQILQSRSEGPIFSAIMRHRAL
ncbi:hypothetical protein FRC19_000550 [Serendipita sp. 401]|nr:hypothetical protein FRC19_000550 [Serendipita sp. 401]KAG9038880.1 hypothetical protein FS842_003188 [Serendipita sp. 407]